MLDPSQNDIPSTGDPNGSPVEYYYENGFIVFTEKYHLKRGFCCGNGCRHCPYSPKHHKGSKTPADPSLPPTR